MTYSVIGIGNPLLDTTVVVEDAFLDQHAFARGGMHLIDAEASDLLLERIRALNPARTPGGSVANALASVVSLGGSALFMGAIGDDEQGTAYEQLLEGIGIRSSLARIAVRQGVCTVLITPDGERTMATHLGAAVRFGAEHLNLEALKSASILHVEGYQLDSPNQTEAALRAMATAREHGARVSLDLADLWLIRRHRDQLEAMIDGHVDILFANETEALELTGKGPEEAVREMAARSEVAVVTLGAEGSLIMSGQELHRIPAVPARVVNTNGAGDTFAGAFLQSMVQGRGLGEAGRIAAYLASQVVASEGARVERAYADDVLNALGVEP